MQNPLGTAHSLPFPFPPETTGHFHSALPVCVCVCVPVARVPDGPQMGTQAGSSCLLALTCERAASRPRVTAPHLFFFFASARRESRARPGPSTFNPFPHFRLSASLSWIETSRVVTICEISLAHGLPKREPVASHLTAEKRDGLLASFTHEIRTT